MTMWGRIDDGDGSEPDAWRGERLAVGGELVCFGALAGRGAGCRRGDLSATGAEDDGCGKVCDLDRGVCGSSSVACSECILATGKRRDGCARCDGAGRCAVEFCDCDPVVDWLSGARRQTGDERGEVAGNLEESCAGRGQRCDSVCGWFSRR